MLRDKLGIDELERLEVGIVGHDSDVLLISAGLDASHDWFLLCIEYIHAVPLEPCILHVDALTCYNVSTIIMKDT